MKGIAETVGIGYLRAALWAGLALAFPAQPAAGQLLVACFGDSVTRGLPYGVGDDWEDPNLTYPGRLQAELDARYGAGVFTVVNHGINGETADGLHAKLIAEPWLDADPDVALLMIGGNDLQAGGTIQQTVGEVQLCVSDVKAHTNGDGTVPKVIVAAIPPNRLGVIQNLGVSLYNSSLQSSLTGHDLFLTENYDDLYDAGSLMADDGLLYDDVHPNAAGHALIGENFRQAIGALPEPILTPGDANIDQQVNVCDLGILGYNFGLSGKTWIEGDFTGDGQVDSGDLDALAAHYVSLSGAGAGSGAAAIPEPGSACLLACLAAGSILSRWR